MTDDPNWDKLIAWHNDELQAAARIEKMSPAELEALDLHYYQVGYSRVDADITRKLYRLFEEYPKPEREVAVEKYWLYEGRHGERMLFDEDQFEAARRQQDEDNRMTLAELLEQDDGASEVSGSEAEGYFSIDDGGTIVLLEVER